MTFSSSQVPRAEQLNAMLRQTIQPYASSAARDTALAAVLKEGMLTYLEDTNTLTMYDGAAWVTVALTGSVDAGSLTGATLAAGVTASSLTSVGTLASLDVAGDLTVDTDTLHVDSTLNRVGIGTTSPRAELDVSTATGSNPSTPTEIAITTSSDTTWVDGDVWGKLAFRSADTSGGATAGDIAASISASQASTFGYTTDLRFATRGDSGLTTKMHIDQDGSVGIGDTSPQSQIDVKSTTARAYHFHRKAAVGVSGAVVGGIVQIGDDGDATNPDTSDYWMLFRRGNGSTLGSIRGTAGASVNFLATSDATLKTDNGLVDEARVGSIIDALQIHDFDWNEGTVTNQIGVFAQEAIDVLPESIVAAPGEDEDGNYMPAGLDYSKIVPILIAECQFLRQRVAALEAT